MGRTLHVLKEITSFITTFILLIILFTSFVVMLYSLYYLPGFIDGEYFAIPIFILVPVPLLLTYLVGVGAYVWYVFLAATLITSITIFAYFGMRDYVKQLMTDPLSYRTNQVKEYAEVLSAILFMSILITLIMQAIGVQTPSIGIEKMPLYSQMLQLLHASFYEEFLVRFMLLGVPVFLWRSILSMMRGERRLPLIQIFGGHYQIGIPEITFMLISSAIFGIAHTPAWGWWKFFPTFIAGLGMAYLYLKYGMHLSIIMHFTVDYMSIPMSMNSEVYVAFGFLLFIVIGAGLIFTISYTLRFLHHFGLMKKSERKIIRPVPPPPWIDVKCPNCGGQHFVYLENGKLKCINCGTVFEMYQEQSHQSAEEENPPESPL